MNAEGWNPRYLAWCRAVSCGPEEQPFRGAHFIIWIGQKWREWDALTGQTKGYHNEADHEEFDAWLTTGDGGQMEMPGVDAARG